MIFPKLRCLLSWWVTTDCVLLPSVPLQQPHCTTWQCCLCPGLAWPWLPKSLGRENWTKISPVPCWGFHKNLLPFPRVWQLSHCAVVSCEGFINGSRNFSAALVELLEAWSAVCWHCSVALRPRAWAQHSLWMGITKRLPSDKGVQLEFTWPTSEPVT